MGRGMKRGKNSRKNRNYGSDKVLVRGRRKQGKKIFSEEKTAVTVTRVDHF